MSRISTACFSFTDNGVIEYARELMLSGEWTRAVEMIREGHVGISLDEMEAMLRGSSSNEDDADYVQELGEVYDHILVGKKRVRVESYVNVTTAMRKMQDDLYYRSRFPEVFGAERIKYTKSYIAGRLQHKWADLENFYVFDSMELKNHSEIREWIQKDKQKSVHDEFLIVGEIIDCPYFLQPTDVIQHLEDNLYREIEIDEVLDFLAPSIDETGADSGIKDDNEDDISLHESTSALEPMTETSSSAMTTSEHETDFDASIDEWREQVRQQAGHDVFLLSYQFEGQEKTVEVPRVPFERWALKRPGLFFLSGKWKNVAPHDFKMNNDCRDHSDWMLATGIDFDRSLITGEYRAMNRVAGIVAFDILERLTKRKGEVVSDINLSEDQVMTECRKTQSGIIGKILDYVVDIVEPCSVLSNEADLIFVVENISKAELGKISFMVMKDGKNYFLLIGA